MSWATAVTRGFLLCGMALPCGSPLEGMPAACCLVALAFFTWAAMSFFGSPSEPFCGTRFTRATGSHASVAGWDRPTCVPCCQSFLVCLLWLCLALVRRLECLRCLKMQMVYSDRHLLRTSFGKKTPDGLQVAHLLSGHLEQQTMFLVYLVYQGVQRNNS